MSSFVSGKPILLRSLAAFLFCLSLLHIARADTPEIQSFDSESQRLLYYRLVKELRCPKCQNQNIADSNSQIAIDLRNQVARLVRENQGEEEIKQYMVNRYGDFVLYKPPVNKGTLLLWYGPLVMAALGMLVFVLSVLARKKNKKIEENLNIDEQGEH